MEYQVVPYYLSFQLLRLVQKTTETVRIFAFCRRERRSLLAAALTGFIFKLMAKHVTLVSLMFSFVVCSYAVSMERVEGGG